MQFRSLLSFMDDPSLLPRRARITVADSRALPGVCELAYAPDQEGAGAHLRLEILPQQLGARPGSVHLSRELGEVQRAILAPYLFPQNAWAPPLLINLWDRKKTRYDASVYIENPTWSLGERDALGHDPENGRRGMVLVGYAPTLTFSHCYACGVQHDVFWRRPHLPAGHDWPITLNKGVETLLGTLFRTWEREGLRRREYYTPTTPYLRSQSEREILLKPEVAALAEHTTLLAFCHYTSSLEPGSYLPD